jgi:flavin-dependent dehydrogenase
MQKQYDVIILGGGLAGLCLSIQIKRQRPETSILVLEAREQSAATAAHKVGESTVELGSYYLREVLDLKDYLEAHELPKHGLRFFFPSPNKADITSRVELGPRDGLTVPSHQLDRGTLENELERLTKTLGTEVILGARVKDVELASGGSEVSYMSKKEIFKVKGLWIADASGRGSVMKRKLGFQKDMDHAVNAIWFRLKGKIDIDDWSTDTAWRSITKPGLRYYSTVHFMDKGYWVWVIPLGSGNTSIGIVADPAVHPFENYNTYDKSMKWLEENEPLCAKMLAREKEDVLDFKILKHYAHHTGQLYSADARWGVTGEAGAFLDPLYSPGTDFIAMNNSWLSDLILRDLKGEDILLRAAVYQNSHLALVDSWIPIYQNKYPLMGSTQIMTVKIFWDWAIYWSVPTLLFTNNALTDIKLLKELFSSPSSLGRKFGQLHKVMQDLFIAWGPHETKLFSNHYIDLFDMKSLLILQQGIMVKHEPRALVEQVAKNMETLEKMAAQIFRLVSHKVHGTPLDMKVDPYKISLEKGADTGMTDGLACDPALAKELDMMWFYGKKEVMA